MKELSTDLDRTQEEKYLPEHTRHLISMLLCAMIVGLFVCYAIVFIILYADAIDKIKPEVQLIIVMCAFLSFAILRGIVWFRNLG